MLLVLLTVMWLLEMIQTDPMPLAALVVAFALMTAHLAWRANSLKMVRFDLLGRG